MNEYENTIKSNPDPVDLFGFVLGKWNCVYILIALWLAFRFLAYFFLSILKKRLQ